ncbi:MAG: hypothetical protein ACFFHV_21495 [Promethearchaeota archaeon]
MYMDFSKLDKVLYVNYYLEEFKLSVKIPINNSNKMDAKLRIEEFEFTNHVYLTEIE